jgi:chaperone required for assembly of F1-ATPase
MACSNTPCIALHQTFSHPDAYRQQVLTCVLTDKVCYYADLATDRILFRRQEEAWYNLYVQPEQTTSPFAKELTKAVEAARLEVEFQVSSWGWWKVDTITIERLNCTAQLHAVDLLSDSLPVDRNITVDHNMQ